MTILRLSTESAKGRVERGSGPPRQREFQLEHQMQPFSRVRRVGVRALALCALLVTAPACDDGPVVPPENFQPLGTWNATTFTATTGSGIHDLLELGGFIILQLQEDNVLAGTYALPEFEGQPSDEFPISGTWTLHGRSTIQFEHDGDSYLRHLSFTGGGNQMTGTGTIDGIDIHIILQR